MLSPSNVCLGAATVGYSHAAHWHADVRVQVANELQSYYRSLDHSWYLGFYRWIFITGETQVANR